MEVWQIWGIIGIILLIVEMFTPALFFLNLSLAAIVTGIVGFYIPLTFTWQILLFSLLSAGLLIFLRPMLVKIKDEPDKTGIKAAYYGQNAKVTEKITANSGRISIFGEAWEARTESGDEVEVGENVKILHCQGLTMIVEKI